MFNKFSEPVVMIVIEITLIILGIPIGLWMQWHVNEGKEELNFAEFKNYKLKRQKHKLEEILEQVNEHEMPLWSYTLIHTETKLSAEQMTLLTNWAKQAAEKIIVPAP
jgi:hypothetical protein